MAFVKLTDNLGPLVAPDFLSAESPRGLRRLMLRNNIKHKGFVRYEAIQYVAVEKRWYAWFYIGPDKEQSIDEMVSEANGNS